MKDPYQILGIPPTASDEEVKELYDANRAQFPGSFDDEKAKVMDALVKSKAPEKAKELDKEVEAIRETVKYWKPEKPGSEKK